MAIVKTSAWLLLTLVAIAAVPAVAWSQQYPITVIAPGKGPYTFPQGYQTPWDKIEIMVTEKMSPNLFVLHGSQGLDAAHPDASGGRVMALFGPDQHRIRAAKLAANPFHRGVEGGLQLLVVRRQGGVGDLHAGSGGGHQRAPLSELRNLRASARVIGVQGVAGANYGTDMARGTPKARLRGEKSLALDGANHRWRGEPPQEKLADPERQSLARWNRPNRSSRDGG